MPNSSSSAEIFFRKLSKKGQNAFSLVDALINSRAEENEWRDFKEAAFFDAPLPAKCAREKEKERQSKVKELWSENLSSFANSGGGLLIWGIRAPNRVAEKQSLAGDAAALADRLKELQAEAAEPPIQGVEIVAATKAGSREGFVVCYIPNSSFSPHRARWAKREYYLRAGDRNESMRTEVLRRMFYPHTAPRLIPTVRLSLHHGDDKMLHIAMSVTLQNCGSASAQDTYVEALATSDRGFENHPAQFWTRRPHSRGFACEITIHPHQTIAFLSNMSHRSGYMGLDELPATVRCEFQIFTQHASALFAEVDFTREELESAAVQSQPISREAKTVLLPSFPS